MKIITYSLLLINLCKLNDNEENHGFFCSQWVYLGKVYKIGFCLFSNIDLYCYEKLFLPLFNRYFFTIDSVKSLCGGDVSLMRRLESDSLFNRVIKSINHFYSANIRQRICNNQICLIKIFKIPIRNGLVITIGEDEVSNIDSIVDSSVVTIGVDEVSNIDSIVDSSVVTIGVDEVSNIDSIVDSSVVTIGVDEVSNIDSMVVSSVVTIGVDEVSNIDSIVDSSVVTIGVDEVSNIDSIVDSSVVTIGVDEVSNIDSM
ncbi:fibronectin type III domain containing 3C1-like, partial [Brachionus plicatilis]